MLRMKKEYHSGSENDKCSEEGRVNELSKEEINTLGENSEFYVYEEHFTNPLQY